MIKALLDSSCITGDNPRMSTDLDTSHERILPFQFPHLELIETARQLIFASAQHEPVGNDLSVVNLYLLAEKYSIELAIENGVLYRYYADNARFVGYTFPYGAEDDAARERALQRIECDAALRGRRAEFCLLTEGDVAHLQRLRPDCYEMSTQRADSDYIYSRDALLALSGTRYHKKRNRLSQTLRQLEQQQLEWHSVRLDPALHTQAILELTEQWRIQMVGHEQSTSSELASIGLALQHWEALQLAGCGIFVEGVLRSYAICSYAREGELNTHFEKCHPDWRQLYALINQETARHFPDVTTINREEDLGQDGLRQAKLSYHPSLLIHKYRASLIS